MVCSNFIISIQLLQPNPKTTIIIDAIMNCQEHLPDFSSFSIIYYDLVACMCKMFLLFFLKFWVKCHGQTRAGIICVKSGSYSRLPFLNSLRFNGNINIFIVNVVIFVAVIVVVCNLHHSLNSTNHSICLIYQSITII